MHLNLELTHKILPTQWPIAHRQRNMQGWTIQKVVPYSVDALTESDSIRKKKTRENNKIIRKFQK